MRNFRLLIQYEGTRYQGWQRQESTAETVQGKLETLLAKMCGHPVQVQGAGRTDAGVHAYGQVANFHADTKLSEAEILSYMNRYLPDDIGVISVKEASERFHSRLNARGKTYRYRVLNSSLPHIFDRRYVYEFPERLNLEAMRQAAESLCGTHDFKAFTSAKRGKKSTVRSMEEIRIERCGDEVWFTFQGDGFLYHMVRILVGTLLMVGTGELAAEAVSGILEAGLREKAGPLVPGRGLALMEVYYA